MISRVSDQRYRNLLRAIIVAQFVRREQSSILGVLWSVLNPLLMLTIIYVIFNNRMGSTIENYAVYLLIGIVIYTHFSNSTTAAMRVFQDMGALTANAIFPKEILVVAVVFSRDIEFCLALLVAIFIAGVTGVTLTGSVLLVIFVILLQTAFTLAVSLILSFTYLYVRDIEHVYQVLLRLLFFLTPIFYQLDFLGEGSVRTIVLLNPLTHITMFARSAILGGDSLLMEMIVSLVLTAVFLAGAMVVFRKMEPYLAERV